MKSVLKSAGIVAAVVVVILGVLITIIVVVDSTKDEPARASSTSTTSESSSAASTVEDRTTPAYEAKALALELPQKVDDLDDCRNIGITKTICQLRVGALRDALIDIHSRLVFEPTLDGLYNETVDYRKRIESNNCYQGGHPEEECESWVDRMGGAALTYAAKLKNATVG